MVPHRIACELAALQCSTMPRNSVLLTLREEQRHIEITVYVNYYCHDVYVNYYVCN